MWMHHTVEQIPTNDNEKHLWQKKHLENKTGSKDAYKPISIKKNNNFKKYDTWK